MAWLAARGIEKGRGSFRAEAFEIRSLSSCGCGNEVAPSSALEMIRPDFQCCRGQSYFRQACKRPIFPLRRLSFRRPVTITILWHRVPWEGPKFHCLHFQNSGRQFAFSENERIKLRKRGNQTLTRFPKTASLSPVLFVNTGNPPWE